MDCAILCFSGSIQMPELVSGILICKHFQYKWAWSPLEITTILSEPLIWSERMRYRWTRHEFLYHLQSCWAWNFFHIRAPIIHNTIRRASSDSERGKKLRRNNNGGCGSHWRHQQGSASTKKLKNHQRQFYLTGRACSISWTETNVSIR